MPIKSEREYRKLATFEVKEVEDNESRIVEGYASTFQPYVMWTDENGIDYSERIEPTAFDDADMSDVIFQCDHSGAVMARTSNGSIMLNIDEHGLHQVTDLSRTSRAREMYEEIKAGMYREMSFAFIVKEYHFDRESRTRVIDRIGKVFDISAVSFGANPTTEIQARSYFNGEIERERQELSELEAQKRKIRIMLGVTK